MNAPGHFASHSRGRLWWYSEPLGCLCALGWTVACWKGVVVVQATWEPWVCAVTLDQTILYSWQPYKAMPLVMIEKWTGEVYPQDRSFARYLQCVSLELWNSSVIA